MALRRAADAPRSGQPSALLIVGLANPGAEYEGSRHNVGGDAVRELAHERGARWSSERRQRASLATLPSPLGLVTLAVPATYMNESGAALPPLLRRAALVDLAHLVVVHDELDLEPGRLQLKVGGGLAGHNGLRSIAQVIGSREFARLRIGIGTPAHKAQGADWVLRPLTGERRRERDAAVRRAAEALADVVEHGVDEARERINRS